LNELLESTFYNQFRYRVFQKGFRIFHLFPDHSNRATGAWEVEEVVKYNMIS